MVKIVAPLVLIFGKNRQLSVALVFDLSNSVHCNGTITSFCHIAVATCWQNRVIALLYLYLRAVPL